MGILDNLLKGSAKRTIGVCLTPGIGLEGVILDKNKKQVLNYVRKDVLYNFSTREIQNLAQFKAQLTELLDELNADPKSDIYLVLPNVLFDFIESPAEISSAEIKTMILAKAEEFYLFKRDEPESGWCEVENSESGTQKRYAYTSFQKTVIDQIKDIVADLGHNLIGIESSYSASLRGLYITGLLDEIVIEQASWTLMLINTNSYNLFQLESKNFVSYSEVPIAIKSFSMEEAYQAIIQSSSQLLAKNPSSKLFIISQTDDISAEILKRQMQFDKEIVAIDSNKFAKKPPIEIVGSTDFKKSDSITVASIGAAYPKTDFPFCLDILADDPNAKPDSYKLNITGKEKEYTSAQIDSFLIGLSIIIGLIGAFLCGGVFAYNAVMGKNIENLQSQISELDSQIAQFDVKEEEKPEVDINEVIDEVAEMNVKTIRVYDSIATDIPKNVWLTKYYNKGGNQIAVRGIAESIIDIYEYYKNLRIVSPESSIKLNELRVITSDNKSENEDKFISSIEFMQDKDRLYSFEISNTQIQFSSDDNKDKKEGEENKGFDGNLLKAPPKAEIEQTSDQMTVAQ